MRHARAAVLAAALLAGCGQPLLSARLEIPELRMTSPAQAFPDAALAAPADFCSGTAGCLFTDAEYDLGAEVPVLGEDGVTVDLRLTDVALRLSAPSGSLDGIESVKVTLVDPGSGATTVVASYVKPPGATPADIRVSGNSNLELGPFLDDGRIDLRVEVTYDLGSPPGAFTADVEAGFSLVVTVRYGDLI
jgi:hypothetical protein